MFTSSQLLKKDCTTDLHNVDWLKIKNENSPQSKHCLTSSPPPAVNVRYNVGLSRPAGTEKRTTTVTLHQNQASSVIATPITITMMNFSASAETSVDVQFSQVAHLSSLWLRAVWPTWAETFLEGRTARPGPANRNLQQRSDMYII